MYVRVFRVWGSAQPPIPGTLKKCLRNAEAFRQAPGPSVLTLWRQPTPLTHS